METSPLKLKQSGKKRRSSLDLNRCIICQSVTDEPVRKASSKGIETFFSALNARRSAGDTEVAETIDNCIERVSENEFRFKESDSDIHWHKGCYSSYTSKEHIARLEIDPESDEKPGPSTSKIQRKSFNWKELCLFCEKKSYKKDKNLINVATFEFCSTLEKRVQEKNDTGMSCKVGDFNKLIANEAKYHKGCHSKYIKQERCIEEMPETKDVHNTAFERVMTEILPHLKDGKAFTVQTLLEKYQHILSESISEDKTTSYTAQKLKNKLLSNYGDTVQVLQSQRHGKIHDIVVDKNLKLQDAINTASALQESIKDLRTQTDFVQSETKMPSKSILYYAALLIRSLRKECTGIETQPLDPSDISLEKEEQMIPNDLYAFIAWIISAEADLPTEGVDKKVMKEKNPGFHQKVLSVCQDIVYLGSKGKCRTPKHVGLSLAIHQITQSKDVLSLLNKNGHGISYDEVERIDTTWAKTQTTENGIVVPINMTPGMSVVAAGDNFNRATESLDGRHLDIVNMVLYQKNVDHQHRTGTFGQLPIPNVGSRTIKDLNATEILECPNITAKQPGPKHLLHKVNLDWFLACSKAHEDQRALDMVYTETRMMPMKIFEACVEPADRQIPGWTVFHGSVSLKTEVQRTKIGYCPMIPASATDPNTVYTMMKVFQRMFHSLGQNWTYVTYDEAIYSKAQMIKWRNEEEFKDDHMEMGGMHRAMNFMGDIGKVMEDSGFEDVLIEANVYGPSVIQVILKGKSYNRGVRTHKIANKSLCRLKWSAFQKWMETNDLDIPESDKELIAEDISKVREYLFERQEIDVTDDREGLKGVIRDYIQHTENLHGLMCDFTEEGKRKSHTFQFWDSYLCDLSQLLLDYIAAKRDGNRNLELETFAEMLPLDFACGHTNYARWGTINVTEGQLLKQEKPEVYEAISKDHAAVFRTDRVFSGVWHDMAIEQSLNRECGKFKHLYTQEAALHKYYLTAHLKTEVTENMKAISSFVAGDKGSHKESTTDRVDKDEKAIQEVVNLIQERMVNPFEVEDGANEEEKQPLVNIATSVVASPEVQDDLCNVRAKGQTRMTDFVQNRVQSNEIDFMAPIPKPKLKTFASMKAPMKVKMKKKTETVNLDRQIFSKLTVIAQNRDVDVRNLLKYELTPVPLALFNLDGSMRKNTKAATLKWMEGDLALKQLPPDEHPALLVIDLMMLLRMVCTEKLQCKTFGDLAVKICSIVNGMGYKYTAIVGDSYCNEESIKAGERARRGSVQMQEIRNPSMETPFPRQKQKFLSNPVNKMNLADFVLKILSDSFQIQTQNDDVLLLTGGFKDPRKAIRVDSHAVTIIPELESDQEEADSRMFLCIDYAVKEFGVESVVIWSIDSDVAAMCPRYSLLLGVKLFFKTGVKDHKRFIPMHEVADQIGESMSLVLPNLHALSGCDSTSAFCGIGKQKWMTTVSKNPGLIDGLSEIGMDPVEVTDNAMKAVTHLVSLVYGVKQMDSTDHLRYELFSKKGSSSERLPPTEDALKLHVQRVNYQVYIWMSATTQFLNLPTPVDAGWEENENGYIVPVTMKEPPAPDVLLEFTKCMCKVDCRTNRCKCRKEDMWCTDACGCDSELCVNKVEFAVDQDSDDND